VLMAARGGPRPVSAAPLPLVSPVRRTERRKDGVFFAAAAVGVLAVVFTGFAKTFFMRAHFGSPVLDGLRRAHGLALTACVVSFLGQSLLASAGGVGLHGRLVGVGGFLAAAMVALGLRLAASAAAAHPGDPRAVSFLAIAWGDIALFGSLVAAALVLRRHAN